MMNEIVFSRLIDDFNTELDNILLFWQERSVDTQFGGFVGRIDENNFIIEDAPKGVVLNARILWTFSAAFLKSKKDDHKFIAAKAYDYLQHFFIDPIKGGVYWSVTNTGQPLDTRKQVYAIAFVIYAFAEWYKCCKEKSVLIKGIELYRLLEDHSRDSVFNGYLEAFDREWNLLDDLRLSQKDANESKTMNTHLHLLEAYSNLFLIWPDPALKSDIQNLLKLFSSYFIDKDTGHLKLFFSQNWQSRSDAISYGHDIEASWLVPYCAAIINDNNIPEEWKTLSLAMTNAAMRAIDVDGGLWYEFDPEHGGLIKEKHWWPQAETLIGFFNAWQISQDEIYLDAMMANWTYIKDYIIDYKNGEWFWGMDASNKPLLRQDKVGIWKCPYHNGRACMEMIQRLEFYI